MLLWILIGLAVLVVVLPRLARLDVAGRRRLAWVLAGVVLVLALVYARQLGLAAAVAALLALLPRLLYVAGLAGWLSRLLGLDLGRTVVESVLRSALIELTLDPAGGPLTGRVRAGPFAGRVLTDLTEAELATLRQQLLAEDPKGRYLLDAWRWQHRQGGAAGAAGQAGRRGPARGSSGMTEAEALAILGLEAGASREQVIEAHRRLVQRLHPDRGGSDYLASLLNDARRVLVGS
jgi:hypothetical protein